MDDEIKKYRELLISTLQKSYDNYDKTVLTLSSGALGISFAFISNFVGTKQMLCPSFLFIAWISWSLSVTSVLFSLFFSIFSIKKAIKQVDLDKLYEELTGGWCTIVVHIFNFFSSISFLFGLFIFSLFVYYNLR